MAHGCSQAHVLCVATQHSCLGFAREKGCLPRRIQASTFVSDSIPSLHRPLAYLFVVMRIDVLLAIESAAGKVMQSAQGHGTE